jgi:hypothetical protein
MATRTRLSLPDGYRAVEDQGNWYLFYSENQLLVHSTDIAVIQEHAWRDAWRRVDQELKTEIAALRAGTLPLEQMRRLRQYHRMLDAVAQAASASATLHRRKRPRWRGVAVAAAAAALVIGVMSVGLVPEGPVRPVVTVSPKPIRSSMKRARHVVDLPGVLPSAAAAQATRSPMTRPRAAILIPKHTPVLTLRAASGAPMSQRPVAYGVSVGGFASFKTADRLKHLVRSKGYVVDIFPIGTGSLVVTPPLATQRQAEYVMTGLTEIRLPAQLVAFRLQ